MTLVGSLVGGGVQSGDALSGVAVQTDNACTSGAAAVHLRRGKRSIPQKYVAASQERNVRPRVATGQTGEQLGDGTHDADCKRKRHSDAQLVYSNRSLSKL